MTPYPLNEKQKQLLASIVPGIQNETIGLNWTVSFIRGPAHGPTIFDNLHHSEANFVKLGWKDATDQDFMKFVSCGFFIDRGSAGQTWSHQYALDDIAIIEAFEHNWEMSDTPIQPAVVHNIFQNNTFSGVTNISSIIENSTQYVQQSDVLQNDDKVTFTELMTQLDAVLNEVPAQHEKQAKTVANQARRLAEDISDPDLDEGQKQITLEGLQKAAENLAKVMPRVLPIAMEIIRFASQIR